MNDYKSEIRAMAASVDGQSGALECPCCGEDRFYMKVEDNSAFYICHRAKCELGHGAVRLNPNNVEYTHQETSKPKPAPKYWGSPSPLTERDIAVLEEIFRMPIPSCWQYDDSMDRVVMPVKNRTGHVIGHVLRNYTALSGIDQSPKALAFWENDREIKLHFPKPIPLGWQGDIIAVEDIVSASKLASLGYVAVALLGTHINEEIFAALADCGATSIRLWLDDDALAKAVKYIPTASFYFRGGADVVYTKRDPKNCSDGEIIKALENL